MNDSTNPKIHVGHVLGTTAALFVPMAVLLVKGLALLFVVAALAVLVLVLRRDRAALHLFGPVNLALAALAGWALVTWFWSTTPDETLKTGISFAATLFGGVVLFAGGALLRDRPKHVFENGLMIGGMIGFALIAFEFATNAWLSLHLNMWLKNRILFSVEGRYTASLNPGLAAIALFFWPWAMTVWSRFPRTPAAMGIAAAFALLVLSDADAVVFGVVAGAAVFMLALALVLQAPWVLAGVFAVGVLTAPAIPGLLPDPLQKGPHLSWLSASAAHRILIWQKTVEHIEKTPIFGLGFDTTRGLYGSDDKIGIRYPEELLGRPLGTLYEPIPLHPHNGILQVWLELGGLGALILLGLLLSIVRAIARFVEDRLNRAVALGSMTTGLAIASVSFGAWQSWWLASMLLAAGFMVSTLAPLAGPSRTQTPQPAATGDSGPTTGEQGGPKGPEPTRYGDWERKGRAIDF